MTGKGANPGKRHRAVRRAASAVRGHVGRGINFHVAKPQYGVVTQVMPLLVQLKQQAAASSPEIILDDEDLTFSQTARRYDIDFGIKVDDTLVLLPVASGDWVVMTVVSEKIGFEGPSPLRKNALDVPVDVEGALLLDGVDFWGAWKDKDGKVIGYFPVWPV